MKILRYPSAAADKKMRAIIGRDIDFRKADVQAVTRILKDVKRNGDRALIQYTRQFDAPRMRIADIAVRPEEIAAARKRVDRAFVRALNRAAAQIESGASPSAPACTGTSIFSPSCWSCSTAAGR